MSIGNSQAVIRQVLQGTKSATVTDLAVKVSMGLVPGARIYNGFGENESIDTTDVGAGDWVAVWPVAEKYIFPSSATIDTISSSSGSDTQTLLIDGLDADYNRVQQFKALNGQNKVFIDTPLMRVNNIQNVTATSLLGGVYIYEDTAISGGIPTDLTKVKDKIDFDTITGESNNWSTKTVYTVEAGKTALLYASFSGMTSKNANTAILSGRVILPGTPKYLSRRVAVGNAGTGQYTYMFNAPALLPEKSDIFVQCDDVSANGTGVTSGFDLILLDNTIFGLS